MKYALTGLFSFVADTDVIVGAVNEFATVIFEEYFVLKYGVTSMYG